MKKRKPIPRPGGRSARVRAAVKGAVRWLLQRKTPGEVSIADVAERSGVHAASIYRRWGTIERLMLDMTVESISDESPMPDTGSLADDLVTWGRRIADAVSGPDGPVLLRTTMNAKPKDRVLLLRRVAEVQAMLDRAVARGEPQVSFVDVVDCLIAPIFMRQAFGIGGMDDDFVRELVRRTMTFGRPSTAARPGRRADPKDRLRAR
jgi:AcrR family transcriptional regulator